MNGSNGNMMDLPDEMILAIWNRLTKTDVLYSFVGVNKRLNQLVRDVMYTRSIELLKLRSKNADFSFTDSIMDRFCLDILPQIHELVECLTVESFSMERILFAGEFPHLRNLTLVEVDQQFVPQNFTDESPFAHIFRKQISHLTVLLDDVGRTPSLVDFSQNVFARIFSMFQSVTELDFGSSGTRRFHARLKISDLPSITCSSSSISYLRISVDTIDDCLCLLDGRLPQLRRFVVRISDLSASQSVINETVLTTMKSFSLIARGDTKEYDNQIVPLLRRMTHLEELTLRLTIDNRSTLIDSTHLNDEILLYMARLQTFTFNIVSSITLINKANQQTVNGIQHTFYNGKSHQLMSYIDDYPRRKTRCHIYSLPYMLNDMLGISSNFPGGLFEGVRHISLMDIHSPFEHDFFIQIAHCFPLLTHLDILNIKPQKYKQPLQSEEKDQILSILQFSHLTNLVIFSGCIDYVEQFLVNTNTHLPRLIELRTPYEDLEAVTESFTRFATRHKYANIERLIFDGPMVHSKDFYAYFPRLK